MCTLAGLAYGWRRLIGGRGGMRWANSQARHEQRRGGGGDGVPHAISLRGGPGTLRRRAAAPNGSDMLKSGFLAQVACVDAVLPGDGAQGLNSCRSRAGLSRSGMRSHVSALFIWPMRPQRSPILRMSKLTPIPTRSPRNPRAKERVARYYRQHVDRAAAAPPSASQQASGGGGAGGFMRLLGPPRSVWDASRSGRRVAPPA